MNRLLTVYYRLTEWDKSMHISAVFAGIVCIGKTGIFFHHVSVIHDAAAGYDNCLTFYFHMFTGFIVDANNTVYFSVCIGQNIDHGRVQQIFAAAFFDVTHSV